MRISLQNLRRLAWDALAPPGSDGPSRVGFGFLLLFVAAAPLLYGRTPDALRPAIGGGAVMPAGNLLIEICAFVIAAVTFFSKSRVGSLRPLAVPAAAAGGLVLLGILQLVPIPETILDRLAPVNARVYHDSAEVLKMFGRDVPPPRISIAPIETAGTVLLILAYGALFFSAATLLRHRGRRRLFVLTLLTAAGAHILLAATRVSLQTRVHGAFYNPNHFAGYLGMILALAFGLLWREVLTGPDRLRSASARGDRFEKRFAPLAARILLWSFIAGGILLTQSRGGILAGGVTTLVLLLLAGFHRRNRTRRAAVAVGALLILAALLMVGVTAGGTAFLRFLEPDADVRTNLRVTLWKTSVEAWREFQLLGSGLGTFREAFRRVQPRGLPGRVEQAHNEFFQLLVTGGTVGAILGLALFGSLFVLLLRAWRREKHREESALVLAGFGALLSLTIHGLVEFNFSIPVIPATLACVLGAAWAAGRER